MVGQVQDRFRKDDDNQNFKANDESDRLRRLEEWQNVKVLQKDKKASEKIKKISQEISLFPLFLIQSD